jgi:hypothetical protein
VCLAVCRSHALLASAVASTHVAAQEFCEALGPNKSATVIKQHWQSWVQQSDIQALAAANVTHL